MAIAMYLRLSEADGDLGTDGKDESNSIENQRILLQQYIEAREDLEGEITEYVDDGYSGTNFNRPAFCRMIEDAKKGRIHVIVVKDLSRLGRDYIVAGDYIEQIFPMLQVRFIAANNGYDSAKIKNPNAGFDVAVSNLINTFYSRDLSKKLKAANKVRWKNGISTSCSAPFGMKKDPEHKGRFIIDSDTAPIVRFIFEQAIAGNNTTEIARLCNERGFLTPGQFLITKGLPFNAVVKVKDSEQLWDAQKVLSVIQKYDYTGAMVMGKTMAMGVGSKRRKVLPRNEWTIVEGVHEAIVSHDEFEAANLVVRRRRQSCFILENSYPLKGKVRCGNCRLALQYQASTYKEYFSCRHAKQVGEFSDCCTEEYSVKHVEAIVWNTLKDCISTMEWLGYKAGAKAKTGMKIAKESQKAATSEIESIREEKIRQYEFYADGTINKENYLKKKAELDRAIVSLTLRGQETKKEFEKQTLLWEEAVNLQTLAKEFAGEEKLTVKMVNAFIDAVYIYDSKHVEVVFLYEDVIRKLAESIKGQQ